jgi:hypothetical protein
VTNELGVGNATDPAGRIAGGQRPADSEGSPIAEFYDTNGTPTYPGNPPDSLNAATGVNAVDQVVGSPAFVWKPGTLTALPRLAGAPAGHADAVAVNTSGQIVGWSGIAGSSNSHAALHGQRVPGQRAEHARGLGHAERVAALVRGLGAGQRHERQAGREQRDRVKQRQGRLRRHHRRLIHACWFER